LLLKSLAYNWLSANGCIHSCKFFLIFCSQMRLNFVGMVLPTQRSHNLGHREIHTRQYNSTLIFS